MYLRHASLSIYALVTLVLLSSASAQDDQCSCDAADPQFCDAPHQLDPRFHGKASPASIDYYKCSIDQVKQCKTDRPDNTTCKCIATNCEPTFRFNIDADKCVGDCSYWCEDTLDCADDDDNQHMCEWDCQAYCVSTAHSKCAGDKSRDLGSCEQSCAHFMQDSNPDGPDPISYSSCVYDCSSSPATASHTLPSDIRRIGSSFLDSIFNLKGRVKSQGRKFLA
mmetsp:Transcript_10005/g.11660  ORF Transcript_10005/g.11660 Transcript_10005/m.11660 type:complete len:223 (-) Transcript_10005:333-1001(-)|eukprot:CAMPEP_0197861052 /NCGR_PEP_ID=MMETSP1438-20131217/36839_1 /TAXON_ID=1461541 /ORGANISM="Pterosperma sp., Strain CCMP1384" /LENGTH=222 /DNA_ID=CAMNT_0043478109 /DNA_START=170 /DNA_END=838 /DNA_ORIENTATION=+